MLRRALSILVIITGGLALFYANIDAISKEREARMHRLQVVHENTIKKFIGSIETFGLFTKGLKAHLDQYEKLPSQQALFTFVKQLTDNNILQNSLTISIMDTSHNFRYSFDQSQIDPAGLIGRNVRDLAGVSAIEKYNNVMSEGGFHLLGPHNLVEGKVGLSLNFPVMEQGIVTGYASPIVDIKQILAVVYNQQLPDEFVFHFSTGDGIDFDREHVHDDTRTHNNLRDSLSYKNFNIPQDQFLYATFDVYGSPFRLGVAYLNAARPDIVLPLLSISWFLFLTFLIIYINNQASDLETTRDEVEKQRVELKRRNEKLEEAHHAKNRFMSILGHDIKGPLRSIRTMIDLRQRNQIANKDLDEYFASLNDVSSNTLNLVENVLEWARVNDEQVTPKMEHVDVQTLIDEIIELTKSIAQQKAISIDLDIAPGCRIYGDVNMLATIFRNLVGNALKYTENNGNIKLLCTKSQDQTVLKVIDDGVGMTQQELDDLFKLDKDAPSRGTAGELGTGLGMTLIKEYIDLHHAKITVTSQPRKGTQVNLVFPESQVTDEKSE